LEEHITSIFRTKERNQHEADSKHSRTYGKKYMIIENRREHVSQPDSSHWLSLSNRVHQLEIREEKLSWALKRTTSADKGTWREKLRV
jgi:hypothetical protein